MTGFESDGPNFSYPSFDLPENVQLTFHFSPHLNAHDLPDSSELSQTIRRADIVIPEYIHSPGTRKAMSEVALGNRRAYLRLRDQIQTQCSSSDWLGAFASALYASKTPVTNIDIDIHHPAVENYARTEAKVIEAMLSPDSDYAEIRKRLVINYEALRQRDQSILQNIAPEIEAVIDQDRKLEEKRKQQPLAVHIFYGSMHTSLFDATIHKQAIAQTPGFSAQKTDDSTEGPQVQMYADFLRNREIRTKDIHTYLAFTSFCLKNYRGAFAAKTIEIGMRQIMREFQETQ